MSGTSRRLAAVEGTDHDRRCQQTFNTIYVNTVHEVSVHVDACTAHLTILQALCQSILEGFILVWVGALILSLPMACIVCGGGRTTLAGVRFA